MHGFENRPLLDMKFEVGGYVHTLHRCLPNPFDLNAALTQCVFQANPIAVDAIAIGFDGMRTCEC